MFDTKAMKYLSFLSLLIKLLFLGLIFASRLFLASIHLTWRLPLLLFLTVFLILGIMCGYYLQLQKNKARQTQTQINNQLFSQKETLEKILIKQPTHRDTLIDLAIISCRLEVWEDCQEYLQRAKQVDPNNPIFEQLSPFISQ